MLNISVKNMKTVMSALTSASEAVTGETKSAIKDISIEVTQRTKYRTPIDTWALRESIGAEITNRGMSASVRPAVNDVPLVRGRAKPSRYAHVVHEGLGSNRRYGRRPYLDWGLKDSQGFIERRGEGIGIKVAKSFRSMR